MAEELIEKLKGQIIETLNLEDLEPSDIDANDPLFGDDGIGLDSIDALELIVLILVRGNYEVNDVLVLDNFLRRIPIWVKNRIAVLIQNILVQALH